MTFGNKCYFFFNLSGLHQLSKIYLSYLYNRPNSILHICFEALVLKLEYASESPDKLVKTLIAGLYCQYF